MFASLRSRLLISHIAAIGLTLVVAALALALMLVNNSLPSRIAYDRLFTIARTSQPLLSGGPEQVDRHLEYIANANNIRILRLGPGQTVVFESQQEGRVGQPLALDGQLIGDTEIERGTYTGPQGQVWLYLATPLREPGGMVLFATPRPRGQLLDQMGDSIITPLARAGLIGLAAAVIFALVISSSVAKPLRRVSQSAHAIAEGDYDQRAPEKGPKEVRDLARSFNRMAEQVQRTQTTQRDFLANVSHELKTPLTSIQGYAQAITDGAAAKPDAAARVIYDESTRMRRLVDELLDLARIESGQTPFLRERVDLAEVLEAVQAQQSLTAEQKQITLLCESVSLPPITGDGDRLAQVFVNLIANAIAHTPAGGHVTIRAEAGKDGLSVTVRDTGPGIPQEDLGRIFERFYQVDKSRVRGDKKGTGLGLAISKEIVEAHKGRITVESSVGEGAAFTVWLPLPRAQDETLVRKSRR